MPVGSNGYFFPVVQKPTTLSTTAQIIILSGSIYTAGEELQQRDAVYINSDNKIYKTNPTSISSSAFIGFCENDTNTNNKVFVFSSPGQNVNGFSGLSIGSRYFKKLSCSANNNLEEKRRNQLQ